MLLSTMTAGIALLVTVTLSAAASISSDVPGLPYPLTVPTITGTYNGHSYELKGTTQDVLTQLEAMYGPNTDPPAALVPREVDNKSQLICIPVPGQSWVKTNWDDTNANIASMNAFNGQAHVFQNDCALVAYHNQACVVLCNDNNYPIDPMFPYLASYAQDIANQCTLPWGRWGVPRMTGGQEFDTDRYNIIVRQCP